MILEVIPLIILAVVLLFAVFGSILSVLITLFLVFESLEKDHKIRNPFKALLRIIFGTVEE